MQNQPMTTRILACCALGLVVLISGCLGPWGMRKTRPHYNEAAKLTSEQELLLNLVRMRYADMPYFLKLNSVNSQWSLNPEIGLTAEADGGKPRYFGTGNISLEDRPTISYAPRDGSLFARSLVTPLNIENLALLARLGWDNEVVFRLVIKQINGVENAIRAGGPVPEFAPEYAEFHELAWLANKMRDLNYSDIVVEEEPLVVATGIGLDKPSGDQLVRAAESSFSIDASGDQEEVTKRVRQLTAVLKPRIPRKSCGFVNSCGYEPTCTITRWLPMKRISTF